MPNEPLGPGNEVPDAINLIIEIQRGGRNKYEFNKATGKLTLDRVNGTALGYPADYGYVPGTLCGDGDPLDGLLIIDESVPHGAIVSARPIGVLYMIDEGEADEKLICVPAKDISKDHIQELADLGDNFKKVLEHFYRHYKDWKNNWQGSAVEFKGFGDRAAARQVIQDSIARASSPT